MRWSRALCFASCVFLLTGLIGFAGSVSDITISAPGFAAGQPIPARYSYKGKNASPELRISNVPANTKSLVLIVDDPDSPSGLWTHWLLWNIPATTTVIAEGKVPSGAVQGRNSFGNDHYDGPVPPSGTHRYFFRVYALGIKLSLPTGSERSVLETAMRDYIIGAGETFGTYSASP